MEKCCINTDTTFLEFTSPALNRAKPGKIINNIKAVDIKIQAESPLLILAKAENEIKVKRKIVIKQKYLDYNLM